MIFFNLEREEYTIMSSATGGSWVPDEEEEDDEEEEEDCLTTVGLVVAVAVPVVKLGSLAIHCLQNH
jgi:hypothetical protein